MIVYIVDNGEDYDAHNLLFIQIPSRIARLFEEFMREKPFDMRLVGKTHRLREFVDVGDKLVEAAWEGTDVIPPYKIESWWSFADPVLQHWFLQQWRRVIDGGAKGWIDEVAALSANTPPLDDDARALLDEETPRDALISAVASLIDVYHEVGRDAAEPVEQVAFDMLMDQVSTRVQP